MKKCFIREFDWWQFVNTGHQSRWKCWQRGMPEPTEYITHPLIPLSNSFVLSDAFWFLLYNLHTGIILIMKRLLFEPTQLKFSLNTIILQEYNGRDLFHSRRTWWYDNIHRWNTISGNNFKAHFWEFAFSELRWDVKSLDEILDEICWNSHYAVYYLKRTSLLVHTSRGSFELPHELRSQCQVTLIPT